MANNILKIKTIRIPPYVKNLDPERYKGRPDIIKIQPRAKKKTKKKKRNA